MIQGVPVIDAQRLLADEGGASPAPSPDLVRQVADAATEWGFFQLINHGLDEQLLAAHLAVTKSFFALPAAVKGSVRRTRDNAMGYNSQELTKQRLDLKEVFDMRPSAHPQLPDDHPANADPSGINQWPQGEPAFRRVNEAFLQAASRASFRLLEVIALALGLPHDALHHLFMPSHSSRLRLNYYPVMPHAPPDALGISPHKDSGFLTVLLQDEQVPGLEVLHQGQWSLVPPLPGALTINVGDMLQVVSNDRFVAANHRVLQSSSRARISRAFFFNPGPAATISPITQAPGEAPRYEPIVYRDFYMTRLDGNYKDLGVENQIDEHRR